MALSKREAELNQKEAALKRMELELKSPGALSTGAKNWPGCCPALDLDIAGNVPAAMQGMVQRAYWAFLVSQA